MKMETGEKIKLWSAYWPIIFTFPVDGIGGYWLAVCEWM